MFNFVVVNQVLKMFLWRKLKKKKSLKDYIFEKYFFMLFIKVQTIFTNIFNIRMLLLLIK